LKEAFSLFDADQDGKINLEEFEFFLNGFAKDMNKLRDSKVVQEMLAEAKKHSNAD
jgi:Ca2+-binding EF-hand superfamily protein